MISPAVKELLQLQVPLPSTVGDWLDHPRQCFAMTLLACVAAGLWQACIFVLSRLIKARLGNSSSSTSVLPMARDQAGIRKWTSKIARNCRFGLLYVLDDLESVGWILLMKGLEARTWLGIPIYYPIYFVFCHAFVILEIIPKIFNGQWRQRTTAEVQAETLELLKLSV